jgi:hypothetical protein
MPEIRTLVTEMHTRRGALGFLCGLGVLLTGCKTSGGDMKTPLNMGERVRVGPLMYTVLESEWRSQIGEDVAARLPTHRFLMLRLSVTNSGADQVAFPFLALLDDKKARFMELSDGTGVPEWLGYIRRIEPAQTLDGRIVFDVPPAEYNLELTDGNTENESTAMVKIKHDLSTQPTAVPTPIEPGATPLPSPK